MSGRTWDGLSPEGVAHLPQNKLLPLLLNSAARAGGQVLMDHKIVGLAQDASGVLLQVQSEKVRSAVESSLW